jgi:hypothetical protein
MSMSHAVTIIASVLALARIVGAQQPPSTEPIVQIGMFGYSVDGRNTSAAYDTEPSLASTVYTNETLCRVGAGSRTPPPEARHAWRFSGSIVSKTAEEVVLRLTWQRIIDDGRTVAGPENVLQLTLRAGDSIPLETIVPESSACSSVRAAFEVRYMPRMGRTAVRAVGAQAGGADKPSSLATPMQVDLWLVHSAPGREDEVVHQVVLATGANTEFTFPPVSISTPQGKAAVQVRGSFSVSPDRQLSFLMTRRVLYADQPARDVAHDVSGTGRTLSPMPRADEVLSFELPPIRRSPGDAALPDQFAVRFKVTPIAP